MADVSSSGAISHLKGYHNIDQNGKPTGENRGQQSLSFNQQNGDTEASSIRNEQAAAYNHNHFKALLYDWIITDCVSFNQLESEKPTNLLIYLSTLRQCYSKPSDSELDAWLVV